MKSISVICLILILASLYLFKAEAASIQGSTEVNNDAIVREKRSIEDLYESAKEKTKETSKKVKSFMCRLFSSCE